MRKIISLRTHLRQVDGANVTFGLEKDQGNTDAVELYRSVNRDQHMSKTLSDYEQETLQLALQLSWNQALELALKLKTLHDALPPSDKASTESSEEEAQTSGVVCLATDAYYEHVADMTAFFKSCVTTLEQRCANDLDTYRTTTITVVASKEHRDLVLASFSELFVAYRESVLSGASGSAETEQKAHSLSSTCVTHPLAAVIKHAPLNPHKAIFDLKVARMNSDVGIRDADDNEDPNICPTCELLGQKTAKAFSASTARGLHAHQCLKNYRKVAFNQEYCYGCDGFTVCHVDQRFTRANVPIPLTAEEEERKALYDAHHRDCHPALLRRLGRHHDGRVLDDSNTRMNPEFRSTATTISFNDSKQPLQVIWCKVYINNPNMSWHDRHTYV